MILRTAYGFPSLRDRALLIQSSIYALAVTVTLALLALMGAPNPNLQVIIAVPLILIIGLPHGATDAFEGRKIFGARLGIAWWLPFGIAYLLVAATVVWLWNHSPAVSLYLFLIVSGIHFGTSDSLTDIDGRWKRLAIFSRGVAPIALPTLLYPHQVASVFHTLSLRNPEPLISWLQILATLSAVGLIFVGIQNYRATHGARRWFGLEPWLEVALLTLAPPILGFAINFGLLHAPRHLIDYFGQNRPLSHRESLLMGRQAFGIWALTLLLLAGFFLVHPIGAVPERATYVVFVGLAALTYPHMFLELLSGWISSAGVHSQAGNHSGI